MLEGQKLAAYYFATKPHILKASGVSDDLLAKVQSIMGWPATEQDYHAAAQVIPEEVVRNIMAVGTTVECQANIREYIDAGVSYPILYPMMDNIRPVVDVFADGF